MLKKKKKKEKKRNEKFEYIFPRMLSLAILGVKNAFVIGEMVSVGWSRVRPEFEVSHLGKFMFGSW